MKKLLSVLLAVALVLSMTVSVLAAEEVEIPVVVENYGAYTGTTSDALTWGDNSVLAPDTAIFSFLLPEVVSEGQTVVVHLKGNSEGDFRVWLLGPNEKTCSNQFKASENGFTTGDFDFYIELTFTDHDGAGLTTAEELAIKGPSYGTNLTNTRVDYIGFTVGTIADVEAAKTAEVQPQIDAAKALVEAVKAVDVADQAALDAAVADAYAAIEAIPDYGFAGLISAKKELTLSVDVVLGEVALAGYQPEIDAVAKALEDSKAAGNDVAAIKAAYDSALAAVDKMEKEGGHLAPVAEKVKELKNTISEIKDLHKAATEANAEAKAAEEAAAKEAEEKAAADAAAKEAATQTTIIVVVIVVVVVAILAVVLVVLKKKKK